MDKERWLGRPLPKRYGLWPGGLYCAVTVDPKGRLNLTAFPIEVWTREGEHLIFHEHRPESAPSQLTGRPVRIAGQSPARYVARSVYQPPGRLDA